MLYSINFSFSYAYVTFNNQFFFSCLQFGEDKLFNRVLIIEDRDNIIFLIPNFGISKEACNNLT